MKMIRSFILLSAAVVALSSCNGVGGGAKLANDTDSMSYSFGVMIGTNLKENSGIDKINEKVMAEAIREVYSGKAPKMTQQKAEEFLNTYFMKLQTKIKAKNLEEGKKFLEENKKKSGVKVLPSGVQYEVIKDGNGPTPKPTDVVTVNYVGKLIDGTEFDSSVKHGQPATFPVNGVIKGWQDAISNMKVGSKWKVVIPSELAYGEQAMPGGKIKPNSTLIFEIELLSIGDTAKKK
jgi:FKBP-type peptidyl-prolyl cis-trans isomerase FklB